MKLLCILFGHVPNRGYGTRPGSMNSGRGYFRVHPYAVDGLDTVHARLVATCERCGEEYWLGYIHLPVLSGPFEAAMERAKEKARKV